MRKDALGRGHGPLCIRHGGLRPIAGIARLDGPLRQLCKITNGIVLQIAGQEGAEQVEIMGLGELDLKENEQGLEGLFRRLLGQSTRMSRFAEVARTDRLGRRQVFAGVTQPAMHLSTMVILVQRSPYLRATPAEAPSQSYLRDAQFHPASSR